MFKSTYQHPHSHPHTPKQSPCIPPSPHPPPLTFNQSFYIKTNEKPAFRRHPPQINPLSPNSPSQESGVQSEITTPPWHPSLLNRITHSITYVFPSPNPNSSISQFPKSQFPLSTHPSQKPPKPKIILPSPSKTSQPHHILPPPSSLIPIPPLRSFLPLQLQTLLALNPPLTMIPFISFSIHFDSPNTKRVPRHTPFQGCPFWNFLISSSTTA